MQKNKHGRRAVMRPASLILRSFGIAVPVLIVSLSLIALAVDRAFNASLLDALAERLEANLLLVVAGLELDSSESIQVDPDTMETRMGLPDSGLVAGVRSRSAVWTSMSAIGGQAQPTPPLLARGARRFEAPGEGLSTYRLVMGLGWEMGDGSIEPLTLWVDEDPRRMRSDLRAFRREFWPWLVLAGALLLAAQWLIFAYPVATLRKVAGEVGAVERGERQQVGENYPRELRPLTDNLNALLASERANAEQYQAALSDLAHGLKTPLAVLRARVESAPQTDPAQLLPVLDELQTRVTQELKRAGRAGRRTMRAPLHIQPVLARLTASIGQLYPNIDFDLAVDPALVATVTERDLMDVAGNLIENAAKYGGGRVRIAARPGRAGSRRSGLELAVADDGPGIDPSEFEHLLQRGVRGDERREGQGLGLSIVAGIVESYGGRIECTRAGPGGARISVTLPG